MRQIKLLSFGWILLVLLVTACNDKEDPVPPAGEFNHAVFVVNEGNFTAGNASLTYYNSETGEVNQQVFYRINGAPLGDVANSISFDDENVYLVVNNSHVVYQIDAVTGRYKAKTTGLTSPRHLLKIDDRRALVSDLYESSLTLISTANMEIISRIPVGRTSENLLKYGDRIFISNWSAFQQEKPNDRVMVLSYDDLQLTDSIQVGVEPNSMVLDKNNRLWVLCSGGFMNDENPSLWKINLENNEVLAQMEFPEIEDSPGNLCINKTGDTLYFLNRHVYRMKISDELLPEAAFIVSDDKDNFYSIGVGPDSHVYITDANDYTRNGTVYRYNTKGLPVDSFEAGIVPGAIGFNK